LNRVDDYKLAKLSPNSKGFVQHRPAKEHPLDSSGVTVDEL
jgi:hypothetical protein